MATLTITLQRDSGGGGTSVRIGLTSGPDVLPHEHEADHRRLVAALFPAACEVQRERPAQEPAVG